jgi:hypothetical protein
MGKIDCCPASGLKFSRRDKRYDRRNSLFHCECGMSFMQKPGVVPEHEMFEPPASQMVDTMLDVEDLNRLALVIEILDKYDDAFGNMNNEVQMYLADLIERIRALLGNEEEEES